MPAKTSWFFCGNCGFRNHPRMNADTKKCEQCGHERTHVDAYDYTPGGTVDA